jgi:hypothetical protein
LFVIGRPDLVAAAGDGRAPERMKEFTFDRGSANVQP